MADFRRGDKELYYINEPKKSWLQSAFYTLTSLRAKRVYKAAFLAWLNDDDDYGSSGKNGRYK